MFAIDSDRMIFEDGLPVSVEYKSSWKLLDCRRVQVGAQLNCIKEVFKVLSTHGYVRTRDKQYQRMDFTPEFQA
jgi:hypothetical protein